MGFTNLVCSIKHHSIVFCQNIILIIFYIIFTCNAEAQSIYIDESFEDWQDNSIVLTTDLIGDTDGSSIDLLSLALTSSEDYLFINFQLDKEINLQENNKLRLFIDIDNDLETGRKIGGIGADLRYFFGDRNGFLVQNGVHLSISHEDIGLITAPTVSSDQFELMISRNKIFNGAPILPNASIKVLLYNEINEGDQIPNQDGGVFYTMNDLSTDFPSYSFSKPENADIRVLSYNVLRDDMFESNKQQAYKNIFQLIQPDIIGFQEIYDHSAKETKEKVQDLLNDQSTQWYYAKGDPDVICVSKYPIIDTYSLDGNAAFWIRLDGKDVVFISAHLPCCDNNYGRQREVDKIMGFIRDLKTGNGVWDIEYETAFIIVGDMNMVGDVQQQKTLFTGDIQNEGIYGPDFAPDWNDSSFEDSKPYVTHKPGIFTWYDEYSSFNPGRLDYIVYSGSVLSLENSFALFTPDLAVDTLQKYGLSKDDSVWASDHMPCVADFQIISNTSISVHQNDINQIFVTPIPADQFIAITFRISNSKKTNFSIYNNLGQLVVTKPNINIGKENNTIEISTKNLVSGVYYLKIERANHEISSVKFIVQH